MATTEVSLSQNKKNEALAAVDLQAIYCTMLRIRTFEQRAAVLFAEGLEAARRRDLRGNDQ